MKRLGPTFLFCGLISISSSGVSAAQSGQVDPAIHYSTPGTLVEIRKGKGPVQLNPYPALTYLHDPIKVNCVSTHGCVIIAQMIAREVDGPNGGALKICAYLDNKKISPDCTYHNNETYIEALQSQRTPQGTHTLQAAIASRTTLEETAGPWNVIYTLYDDGAN